MNVACNLRRSITVGKAPAFPEQLFIQETHHGPAGPQKSVASMKDVRRIFAEWPVSIPRQGLVVTSFGETIPFCNYMLCGELILLERKTPDAQGARRVIMGMDGIQAIKILDAIELARFTAMGFQGVLDGR